MSTYTFKSVIFDLDGVITKTALVHARAWKGVFDEYLRLREKKNGEPFKEFAPESDYLQYVDGKPRYKGVKSFLDSRSIDIPFGDPADEPGKETVCGLGNRKNDIFREVLNKEGTQIYQSSVDLIKQLKNAGIHVAVASSSKNCQLILQKTGLEDLFEDRVDGIVSVELGLKGKPEGDIFVVAARHVGTQPVESVVVEDAVSGVQAGRNGGFGLVLGIARHDNIVDLLDNGADCVVKDLSDITLEKLEMWFNRKPYPLLKSWDVTSISEADKELAGGDKIAINPRYSQPGRDVFLGEKKLVFFLDYDGTLTPIVDRPELAVLSDDMRRVVTELSKKHMVSIVSGRLRDDVENLVKIDGLLYAGSHGFDIKGAEFSMVQPKAQEVIPVVSTVIGELKQKVGGIPGVLIEEKRFSTAVHYRLADKKHLPEIQRAVDAAVAAHPELRLMSGKMVFELLPNIVWDKGKAIRWIMESLKMDWSHVSVIYIGDDVTDEFAFRTIRSRGTGILVAEQVRPSAADYQLQSTDEVKTLFEKIIAST